MSDTALHIGNRREMLSYLINVISTDEKDGKVTDFNAHFSCKETMKHRCRTRLVHDLEDVMTPTVRKSLLQDFCEVQKEDDVAVEDEAHTIAFGNLSLDESTMTARSIDFLGMDTPGKRDGSSPELLGNGSSDMVTKQTSGDEAFAGRSGSDDIKTMVEMLSENDSLIGDGSASHHLPTVRGKHVDIQSISSQTLSAVLQEGQAGGLTLVDCRYPYEYIGGHIQGANNLYTHDQIEKMLEDRARMDQTGSPDTKLVFYCEFSSERGPRMYRYLREKDRLMNKDRYPALLFPEIYLLHGGYQAFFNSFKELCTPSAYVSMHSQSHNEDLRHFRAKSRSWTAGEKRRLYSRCLRL